MKYIMALVGITALMCGMSAIDSSVLGGALLMLSGSLLITPYYRQYMREHRHEK